MVTAFRNQKISFFIFSLFISLASFSQTVQDIHNKYRPQLDTVRNDSARIKKWVWYVYEMMEVNVDSSVPVLERAEAESRRLNSHYGIGKTISYRGQVAIAKNDIQTALDRYITAIPFFEAIGDNLELGYQYNNIGICFYYQGMIEQAAENFLKAATHLEKTKDTSTLSVVYNGLAVTLERLKQFQKAITWYGKAEQISIAQKDTINLISVLVNRSMVYGELDKWDSAFSELHLALAMSNKIRGNPRKATILLNLGITHSFTRNFDSSQYYFRLAEPLLINSHDANDLASLYRGMAKDAIFTKSYALARDKSLLSIRYAEELGDPDAAGTAYGILSEAYEGLGLYKQSLEAYKKRTELADSVLNQKNTSQVNTLETKYRTAQKEKEITEKKLALEKQKVALRKKDFFLLISSCVLVLLVSAAFYVWRYLRQKQNLQQQQLSMLQKEYELQATQAMMEGEEKERARIARNLHDGAGSLLSAARLYIGSLGKLLHALPEIPAYRDTVSLLEDASAEIRETAHNLMPRILHEEGLNAAVEAFCSKFNKQGQLTVAFQSYGEAIRFNRHFELMVYRTIQELINNSVKHADASEIIVQLSFDKDLFSLTVEDDGKGFNIDIISKTNGMGISNLQERMQAFNGNTDIQSSGEGTVVYISFELNPMLRERNESVAAGLASTK
ncbi:tetratricopeptide repeat-containing sensor histidine kinase [Pseudobacter ginsenosidimutans]|uniref:histidine kinase n=1 Tax=Pseudobacter ginsenosidimutans TaxID=661488 RepID=A0A4V2F229_9BACT|nr:tetratricopeptide repeat-containing sensor histidine kinase [Pseudobacter ginsenosidimutans]QEC44372.1 tetratricopeptide repeat protein [Pseudobacter ginsenosidimutans]RZS75837.1 tetratricopeptide repeat protein [Pseudobacter ginsenosidimutans]